MYATESHIFAALCSKGNAFSGEHYCVSRGTVLQQRYGMSVDLNCMEKLLRCLMLCQI